MRVRRPLLVVVLVVVGFALAAVALGAVWSELVWTPPAGTVQGGQWFPLDEQALSGQTGGTSTYVAVAVVGGLLLGLLAALAGTRAELAALVATLLGSALAAYLMWQVGLWLGPPDPADVAAGAADGTAVPGALQVSGTTPFLALPAAALTGLVAVFACVPRTGAREEAPDAAEAG